MKAFLSDAQYRANKFYLSSRMSRSFAIAEAKRILAETEPKTDTGWHYGFLLSPDTIGAEALAESLENFVETLDNMGH